MIVKEVIRMYGENKKYIVYDLYEEAYYERTENKKWYDAFNHNIDNFDNDEVIEVREYAEEEVIIIEVDASSR